MLRIAGLLAAKRLTTFFCCGWEGGFAALPATTEK
jgi:hypothetical protein